MTGLVIKLALALGGVLGLILLLQRASRRWGGAFGAGRSGERIQIVAQRTLGPRLSLALVEVQGRTLLLGVSPQGIRHLADLDPAPRPEQMPPAGSERSGAPAAETAPAAPPDFEGELNRRLAAINQRYLSVGELGREGAHS